MTEIPRAAVITTHNRPAELRRCVAAIAPQVGVLIVIDNASYPPVSAEDLYVNTVGHPGIPVIVIHDDKQPPNLSRLWNVGLARARRYWHVIREHPQWDVAVLNDDAIPPPGWFDAVAGMMRQWNADAASSDPFGQLQYGAAIRHGAQTPLSVATRLCGWAFILRGEWEGAELDERFRWWYGDDDLSHRARLHGGLVHVGGHPVPNTGANSSTVGKLAIQAGQDRAAFVKKWGVQPW